MPRNFMGTSFNEAMPFGCGSVKVTSLQEYNSNDQNKINGKTRIGQLPLYDDFDQPNMKVTILSKNLRLYRLDLGNDKNLHPISRPICL
ncbi:MAG: hypothetical protein ACK5YS_04450, partial [bacterium]